MENEFQQNIGKFERFYELLIETNKKFNLTRITEKEEVFTKHFLDCIALSQYISTSKPCVGDAVLGVHHVEELTPTVGATYSRPFFEAKHSPLPSALCNLPSVIDIGTGAGFPSIPLAIIRSDLHITAIDALQKRVNFVNLVAKELDLPNLTCLHARAEDLAHHPNYREQFDFSTSRAVADLKILAEYNLPFLKIGGQMLAMKSQTVEEEAKSATPNILALGGSAPTIHPYQIPTTDITHTIVIIKKEAPIASSFPRKPNKIGS